MFGSEYADHTNLLMESLAGMNPVYGSGHQPTLLQKLQKFYIRIFGIPEVGYQIRSLYFRKFLQNILNFRPKYVLDAGSGIGDYAIYLAKRYPGAKVRGEEVDKRKISMSVKIAGELGITNASFGYHDISQKSESTVNYDLIVSIDVLEHIGDYQKVLSNFSRTLEKGGYLYLHIPANKQKRLLKRFETWTHKDHIRTGFDKKSFEEMLNKSGFRIIRSEYSFGFFGSMAWEINHLFLAKSLIISGLIYPLLYPLCILDTMINNKEGLCIAILARRE